MFKWPKKLPELTEEQKIIKKDFMVYVHEILPQKYGGILERFSYSYPVNNCDSGGRVLEIGAGLGDAIMYEDLSKTEYYVVEILPEMAELIKRRFPNVNVILKDCQQSLDFPDHFFDRVQAIDVLEHLPNSPAALHEIYRILKPEGKFCVIIPCEGFVRKIARYISARREFRKRYNMDYDWWIKSEHINMPEEIINEFNVYFEVIKRTFFPFRVPSFQINLAVAFILKPRI